MKHLVVGTVIATDEEAKEYLPENPAVIGIYECQRALGMSIENAMIYALKAYVRVFMPDLLPPKEV